MFSQVRLIWSVVSVCIVVCVGFASQSCGGNEIVPDADAGSSSEPDGGIATGSEAGADQDAAVSPCGSSVSTPGTWSKAYGDGQSQHGLSVAVDATGASIVTGYYNGSIDFGGGPLSFGGVADGFIAKIDSSGTHLWSHRLGGTGDDRGWAVATDAQCNVFVMGMFFDTVDFGGGPLTASGSWDVFVVKLDANGKHLWSKRFGDDAQQEGHSIAIDREGNVLLTGMFWGSIDFGGGALTSVGQHNMFVAKLDPNGGHLWSKVFGNPVDRGQNGRGIAVSSAGDVYVTGSCAGPMDFGAGPVAAIGENDAFLLALDSSGRHRWSKRWGRGNSYHEGTGVTVDAAGDVVVAGLGEADTDLGTGVLPYFGRLDVVVGKFTSSGTPVFARRFGSPENDAPFGIATDASRNILLTGYTSGVIDFGNGPLSNEPGDHAFVAKLDPSGVALWSRGAGVSALARGAGIATDPQSNVIAAGTFTGTVDFGSGILKNADGEFGGEDVFLTKLAP